MKTNKIPSGLSVEELYEILSKKYGDVKKISENVIVLKHSKTKINITKSSDGYAVKAGLPVSLLVLVGVVAGIMVVVTQGLGLRLVPQFLISASMVAIVILLVDLLYNMQKKNLLQEFCDSLNIENTTHSDMN